MTAVSAALRAEVSSRAGGRCEYCLVHEDDAGFRHEVDHIVSQKHGGESIAANLAYACLICNRYKGTDLGALDRAGNLVRFFNPRLQQWHHHFKLDGVVIEPLSAEGEVTVKMLRLNHAERVAERHLLQQMKRYPRT
jgi:hypothetical protein